MDRFLKFFQLCKVDVAKRYVYGLVTAEREDKDGETCHYSSTVPLYKAVNDEMSKMSDGENIMPLREMHQLHAVGAGKTIDFDDATKTIRMGFYVSEDSTWKKVLDRVLLGFSQGGKYVRKWKEDGKQYYTAQPGEVSLVDNPCLYGATIEYVKADGTVEAFKVPEPSIVRLSEEDVQRLSKALADSILSTGAQKLDAALAELVRQQNAKGDAMKPEQIKKAAEALGLSEADFIKLLAESDLEKAKKGMAALHAHLNKAHAHAEEHVDHIEKCMKACKDVMGSDSEKALADTLKALVAELAPAPELVLIGKTADGVEIFRKAGTAEVKLDGLTKAAAADGMKAEDVQKLIDTALAKQKDEFEKALAPNNGGTNGAHLRLVDRDGKVLTKAEAADARNPMAVS